MTPHIILLTQEPNADMRFYYTADIAHTDDDGALKVFPSFDAAADERDDLEIDGYIIELPIYSI
ncbi:hypothetical protein FVR03_01145 [Pontibacter qinzhouensis]|uniref:Uncharacterized protein n=1 Tax=Pontibacter qinzhouensis TaxID=2603253 RepID=A0A5C8KB76_9BACT|nr:hypothetical protein [Pontibacter qinzhouensis]TXK52349.1 hypothetical protein FVR03_01145 [Pontibacter qinzhouensis]